MEAQAAVFKLNTDGHRSFHPLGPGWMDTNVLSCVMRCLQIYQSCHSIMFYEGSHFCLPGSSLVNVGAQSQLRAGTIYYNGRVCADADYTWHGSNGVGVCVWVSTDQRNYTDARNACTATGANLYTTKDIMKMDILKVSLSEMVGMFWIGLDDLKVKDSLRWVDDETVITQTQLLFLAKPPGQGSTTPNCIKYTTASNTLDLDGCDVSYNYVCEMKK